MDKLILEKQVGKKSDNDIWWLLHGQGLHNNNSITEKEQDKEKDNDKDKDKDKEQKKESNWEETYQQLKKYRIEGKQEEAMELYTTLNKADPKYLDYEWKLEYEYSVFAYYLGIRNINDQVVTILNKCEEANIIASVLSNMKYYQHILSSQRTLDFSYTLIHMINGYEYTFRASTSCIIPNNTNDGYLLNTRFVHYRIDEKGDYHDALPHNITVNKCVELSKDFVVTNEKFIDVDYVNRRYMGIEDVRLFKGENGTQFIGTGYHQNNTIGIVKGDYTVKMNGSERVVLNSREIKPAFNINSTCEKNWVYVDYKGAIHIIYSWCPLKIGVCAINSDLLHIVEEKPMPGMFKHVRGSTCGFSYTNSEQSELWFVVHLVSYEAPRHYYHILVVFDEQLNLQRYSAPFKFESESIEYCLGLVVEADRVIMTYSTWDRTSKIGIYNKTDIDELLCYS